MWKNQSMVTLAHSQLHEQLLSLPSWEQQLESNLGRLDPLFARKEGREQAKNYLRGLLSPVERKNGWQLAEHLGHKNPYRLQHLLDRAVWDPDALRDELARFVVEHLGTPAGVAVLDESGFLKKGAHSCGVKRQYCGTAGRVENCQVGVFLGYASERGYTLLDRELYVPQEWVADQARRQKAKVPATVAFATKPQLAQQMLFRALAAGVPIAWVTADTVYGSDPGLRKSLQERRLPYVLAVAKDERLTWEAGRIRAQTLARRLPASVWQTLSCGEGAKGPRLYDWATLALDAPEQEGFRYWLLVRRSLANTAECAYYLVFAPQDTPLATLVSVAGTRWSIEVSFENAKGEVGLDEYEVRSWHGWYRHITLALFAQALLVVLQKDQQQSPLKGGPTTPRNSLRSFKMSRGLWCP
jgi:SRSO17 transposase